MDENNSVVAKPKQWWLTTREFWNDTRSEMKKVTWPGRQEVMSTTVVTLIATLIFAFYLWGCDVVFYQAINFIFGKFGASVSA
jgi:preprotein translocase subunit SecE